jgi:S-adenosylhomocysteine hydrolase
VTGFGLDDAALGHHHDVLDGLASRMRTVAAAGRPLDRLAYGLVGQGFAGAAGDAAAAASVVVADLARRAAAITDGVRATREAYGRVEDTNAGRFGGPR